LPKLSETARLSKMPDCRILQPRPTVLLPPNGITSVILIFRFREYRKRRYRRTRIAGRLILPLRLIQVDAHDGIGKFHMQTAPDDKWPYHPIEPNPVPMADLGTMKSVYLADSRAHRDPTIIWGTAVDAQPVTDFVVAESRRANVLLSPAHVLVSAVARTLAEHPHLNRKVIGRRVYPYNEINIVIPLLSPVDKQVDPVFIRGVEHKSLGEIATYLWNEARDRGAEAAEEKRRDAARSPWQRLLVRKWRSFKLRAISSTISYGFAVVNNFRRPNWRFNARFNAVSALVNYLNFPGGAPPMLSFKPSSLPMNAALLTVSMGGPEWRPAVVEGQVVAQRMAPLFVKADHRLVHSHEIAAFMRTLCGYLTNPCRLTETESPMTVSVGTATTATLRAA
jgi:hypothetical protein